MDISVVIASYKREEVLVSTLELFLAQPFADFELILIDQTPSHSASVEQALGRMLMKENFRWLRADGWANLPAARNAGIDIAKGEVVLFVDDDVIIGKDFLENYQSVFSDSSIVSVAGRILGRGLKEPSTVSDGVETPNDPLAKTSGQWVKSGRGCNMAFRRDLIVSEGLRFDPAFIGGAHREESDFFSQLQSRGHRVWFEPSCTLLHLGEIGGGCRSGITEHWRTKLSYTETALRNNRYFHGKHNPGLSGAMAYWKEVIKLSLSLIKRDGTGAWITPVAAAKVFFNPVKRAKVQNQFPVTEVQTQSLRSN